MIPRAPREEVRDFFRARGGAATISELYAHLAGQAASRTVRETSATVEDLLARGDLRELGRGEYQLVELETRGLKGTAAGRLWRAIHRRSERAGGATRAELQALARTSADAAEKWLRGMSREGRLIRAPHRPGEPPSYRLAAGQPGPEEPPAWRWPRRGKAMSKRDRRERGED